ncbi:MULTISPECIES: hypothetical protein [unclassified Streptomyces]|uniref:hypothetical protein n=1 Tax=unclassified Streptomyces TaxID=2593676 RepID=UPI00081E09CE|nr:MULTISPECIES: hypothetical protein [unclassified Streptomyces]MYZ38132.1 hypothetical protein [Streptomyces sp. SID4917]SCF96525.1 hypothetical protein GA0115259_105842 [Streptomyces sp. MnatMP-M17]
MTGPPPQETTSEKTTVAPARAWPVYNVERARAELIAMELLTRGVSQVRIRHSTRLSRKNISRLAALVAEEAKKPPAPRNVCRNPVHRTAAPDGGSRPPGRTPPAPSKPAEPAEPVQMTFSLD